MRGMRWVLIDCSASLRAFMTGSVGNQTGIRERWTWAVNSRDPRVRAEKVSLREFERERNARPRVGGSRHSYATIRRRRWQSNVVRVPCSTTATSYYSTSYSTTSTVHQPERHPRFPSRTPLASFSRNHRLVIDSLIYMLQMNSKKRTLTRA